MIDGHLDKNEIAVHVIRQDGDIFRVAVCIEVQEARNKNEVQRCAYDNHVESISETSRLQMRFRKETKKFQEVDGASHVRHTAVAFDL